MTRESVSHGTHNPAFRGGETVRPGGLGTTIITVTTMTTPTAGTG
jgi:hypothetical protein